MTVKEIKDTVLNGGEVKDERGKVVLGLFDHAEYTYYIYEGHRNIFDWQLCGNLDGWRITKTGSPQTPALQTIAPSNFPSSLWKMNPTLCFEMDEDTCFDVHENFANDLVLRIKDSEGILLLNVETAGLLGELLKQWSTYKRDNQKSNSQTDNS